MESMDSRRERRDDRPDVLRRVASALSFLIGAIVLGVFVVYPTVLLVRGVNVYAHVAVFSILVSAPIGVWFVRLGLTLARSGPVSGRSRIPAWLVLAAGAALLTLASTGVWFHRWDGLSLDNVLIVVLGLGGCVHGITYLVVLRRARLGSSRGA